MITEKEDWLEEELERLTTECPYSEQDNPNPKVEQHQEATKQLFVSLETIDEKKGGMEEQSPFFNEEEGSVVDDVTAYQDYLDYLYEISDDYKKKFDPFLIYTHQAMFLRWVAARGMLNKEWVLAYKVPLAADAAQPEKHILQTFCRDKIGGQLLRAYFNESGRAFVDLFFNLEGNDFDFNKNLLYDVYTKEIEGRGREDDPEVLFNAVFELLQDEERCNKVYIRLLGDLFKIFVTIQGQTVLRTESANDTTTAASSTSLAISIEEKATVAAETESSSIVDRIYMDSTELGDVYDYLAGEELYNIHFKPMVSLGIPYYSWTCAYINQVLSGEKTFSAMVRMSKQLLFYWTYVPFLCEKDVDREVEHILGQNVTREPWFTQVLKTYQQKKKEIDTALTFEQKFQLLGLQGEQLRSFSQALLIYTQLRHQRILKESHLEGDDLKAAIKKLEKKQQRRLEVEAFLKKTKASSKQGSLGCCRFRVRTLDTLPFSTKIRSSFLDYIRSKEGLEHYDPDLESRTMGSKAEYIALNVFDLVHGILFDEWKSYSDEEKCYQVRGPVTALRYWGKKGRSAATEVAYKFRDEIEPRHCQFWDLFSSLWFKDCTKTYPIAVSIFQGNQYLPGDFFAFVPFNVAGEESTFPSVIALYTNYWFEQVGARLVAVGDSSLEYVLPCPVPAEKIDDIARTLCFACPYIMEKSFKTVTELKEFLGFSRLWHLAWPSPFTKNNII